MPRLRRPSLSATVLAVVPLLLVAVVHAPILQGWFRSDDFVHLYQAENKPLGAYLLTQHGGHLQVAKNAVVLALWRAFRFDVGPQFAFVLANHLLNVFLLGAILRATTRRPVLAAFLSALWGVSPLTRGSIGWFSVYGHVLCTTAILWLVLDLLRVGRDGTQPSLGTALRWAVLGLVACTAFGIGLGLVAALPLFAWLVLPSGPARRRAVRLLLVFPPAVIVLYAALQWAAANVAGTPVADFDASEMLRHPVLLAAAGVRYVSFGWGALLLGPWLAPSAEVMPAGPLAEQGGSDMPLALALGAAGLALWGAALWRRADLRRPLLGFALLVAVVYGTIAAGRLPVALRLGVPLETFAVWPRYHYAGPAFLAVLAGLLVVAVGRPDGAPSVRAARAGWALAAVWVVLAVPAYVTGLRASDAYVPADGHTEHAGVVAFVEGELDRAAPNARVYLPNRRFASVNVVVEPFLRFPGWAAVFVMTYPSNEVDGHEVRFGTRRAGQLGPLRGREPGTRIVELLLPLVEVPEPDRERLTRWLPPPGRKGDDE